jgi:hypothetical protein
MQKAERLWDAPVSARSKKPQSNSRDVELALVKLLTVYSGCEGPLSDWERHCLSLAMVFEKHGYFDKAVSAIADVLEPPCPLPAFPEPEPLTIDDIRRTLRLEERP